VYVVYPSLGWSLWPFLLIFAFWILSTFRSRTLARTHSTINSPYRALTAFCFVHWCLTGNQAKRCLSCDLRTCALQSTSIYCSRIKHVCGIRRISGRNFDAGRPNVEEYRGQTPPATDVRTGITQGCGGAPLPESSGGHNVSGVQE